MSYVGKGTQPSEPSGRCHVVVTNASTPSIPSAFGNATEVISAIDQSLAALKNKLTPVLGPDTPSATAAQRDRALASPLAEAIESLADRLGSIVYEINRLTERCEL